MEALATSWKPRLLALAKGTFGADGAHDINHLHRVWGVAKTLLPSYPEADSLIVLAACYLHDIVNLPKNHPERHLASRKAASLAVSRLCDTSFPKDKLPGLSHAIEAHSFSANIAADTIEARIVQDADRLDALGAVGLARLYYTAGRLGSELAHPTDPFAQNRKEDDQRYALDHIEVKLAKLPAAMQTEAGRRLGEERLAWLRSFRTVFGQEWMGE